MDNCVPAPKLQPNPAGVRYVMMQPTPCKTVCVCGSCDLPKASDKESNLAVSVIVTK